MRVEIGTALIVNPVSLLTPTSRMNLVSALITLCENSLRAYKSLANCTELKEGANLQSFDANPTFTSINTAAANKIRFIFNNN